MSEEFASISGTARLQQWLTMMRTPDRVNQDQAQEGASQQVNQQQGRIQVERTQTQNPNAAQQQPVHGPETTGRDSVNISANARNMSSVYRSNNEEYSARLQSAPRDQEQQRSAENAQASVSMQVNNPANTQNSTAAQKAAEQAKNSERISSPEAAQAQLEQVKAAMFQQSSNAVQAQGNISAQTMVRLMGGSGSGGYGGSSSGGMR